VPVHTWNKNIMLKMYYDVYTNHADACFHT
jgi:hypothetical protein